eukprot:TRINITY_DN5233_c0_g1_i1.p2 TRINITY_DN5233_c0_g1~~TRINITY_DN5233_c0_g1_i1.p2  ORF type:complete len:334 (-),score=98.19 TRINITY_DN5233_c0_g1_i1:561-1562(-)
MLAGVAATTVGVDALEACTHVPLHRILSSPGGVYTLPDGRQLKAKRLDVGGCTTMPILPTGVAYPDANSNYTVMSHENDACITGTGRDGTTPTYAGFQAIIIESNGFKFTSDLFLEDLDAQVVVDPTQGWRETASSLGMADGVLVRPEMTTMPDALVAVQPFRVLRTSLKEVGFPSGTDLVINGAAYSSWTRFENCPFFDDPTGKCKAFVSYKEPIDRLLIMYAITQKSINDPNAAAFFSEITLTCGCQCEEKGGDAELTVPIDGAPGTCRTRATTRQMFGCDFLGSRWCETEESTTWRMLDDSGSCAATPSLITKPVAMYTPDANFGWQTGP